MVMMPTQDAAMRAPRAFDVQNQQDSKTSANRMSREAQRLTLSG